MKRSQKEKDFLNEFYKREKEFLKENKIIFREEDSVFTVEINKMLAQPSQGILYDLNRLKEVVKLIFPTDFIVNEFAFINLFNYLLEYYQSNQNNQKNKNEEN